MLVKGIIFFSHCVSCSRFSKDFVCRSRGINLGQKPKMRMTTLMLYLKIARKGFYYAITVALVSLSNVKSIVK